MAQAKSDPSVIRFNCARCKASLKVPVKLGGRYIDCPKCKNRTPVPGSQAEADDEAREYTVTSTAYELTGKCVRCGTKMKKDAIVCVKCGFDHRAGKQLEVVDSTVKQGEPVRGGPAKQAMIAEAVLLVAAIGGFVYRLLSEATWWESGLELGAVICLIALIPAHFMQWNEYRNIPIRDHPLKEQEDRDEREEAGQPFGGKTPLVLLLCIGLGVGTGWLLWAEPGPGGDTSSETETSAPADPSDESAAPAGEPAAPAKEGAEEGRRPVAPPGINVPGAGGVSIE